MRMPMNGTTIPRIVNGTSNGNQQRQQLRVPTGEKKTQTHTHTQREENRKWEIKEIKEKESSAKEWLREREKKEGQ